MGGMAATDTEPSPVVSFKCSEPETNLFSRNFHNPFEELKETLKRRLEKPEPYSVHQYYHTSGWFQRIARHQLFENFTLVVIGFNAVYMGVDTDYNRPASGNPSDSIWIFQVCSHFFCIYFTLEWLIRFMAFKNKLNTVRDAWFITDSVLLALMVTETWIMLIVTAVSNTHTKAPLGQTAILRLFRLMRLTRMVRMLRAVPELLVLVKGMVAACKTVLYVLGLLFLGTYVFAIAFKQLSSSYDYGQTYFPTVPLSMYYLLMSGTLMDNLNQWTDSISMESSLCMVLASIFLVFANILALNLLTGILTQVIDAVGKQEEDERKEQMLAETIQQCVQDLDANRDGKISYEEFCQILDYPQTVSSLLSVGVDLEDVMDFSEHMFLVDGKQVELGFEDFLQMVLDLRSSETATMKHLWNFWKKQVDPSLSSTSGHIKVAREEMNRGASELDTKLQLILQEVQQLQPLVLEADDELVKPFA